MFCTRTLIVKRLGIWALGIASIFASTSAISSKPCRLHERLLEVNGRWAQTREVVRAGGYSEANCPEFVHVTDCLRQSGNPAKTAAEYRRAGIEVYIKITPCMYTRGGQSHDIVQDMQVQSIFLCPE